MCGGFNGCTGSRCGYVEIPADHPIAGKGWGELSEIDMHGGCTFVSNGPSDYPVGLVSTAPITAMHKTMKHGTNIFRIPFRNGKAFNCFIIVRAVKFAARDIVKNNAAKSSIS